MSDPRQILEDGIEAGLHPGAQLYVWHQGEVVIDFACGEARPGVPMKADSIVQWLSTGKPLTAVLVAQLSERRELDLEAPVADVIPEFTGPGKDRISARHLLTHAAGIRPADKIPPELSWNETIAEICSRPLEDNWVAGERAGYSSSAGWYLLAEMIQRITRREFDEYIKSELLDPLGMHDTWLRLPFSAYKNYGPRVAHLHDTAAVHRDPPFAQDAGAMAQCRPGSSARGPIREIGNFYQMLLNNGSFNGRQFLEPETVGLVLTPHRAGLFDETFLHKIDFGLGFILNSNRYGAATVPYGYGQSSSDSAFGHSGAQSSCAFADPARQLVVGWVANGLPGERKHQQRQREINNAIHQYLGLER